MLSIGINYINILHYLVTKVLYFTAGNMTWVKNIDLTLMLWLEDSLPQ